MAEGEFKKFSAIAVNRLEHESKDAGWWSMADSVEIKMILAGGTYTTDPKNFSSPLAPPEIKSKGSRKS